MDDLHDIRSMMERSSRFISLSGTSGILAGFLALIATYIAYSTIFGSMDLQGNKAVMLSRHSLLIILLIGIVTLVLSIGGGIFFSYRKAQKEHLKIWDPQTRRLLINLFIPLSTGGILCLVFLTEGFIGWLAPTTLIFYGLALVNASKYTLSEIRSLGLIEIITGLLAVLFINYGLWFWAFGFGIMHIVYGIAMQRKYGS